MKEKDHCHSQQIKLNNFNVSLWDKKMEDLYPISTASRAYLNILGSDFVVIEDISDNRFIFGLNS